MDRSKDNLKNEDFRLVEAFKNNDQQAFEQLVSKYKSNVFKTIYSVIGNQQEADDIAQEVFLKVYSYLGSFKFQSALSTWLYRITYNETIDYIKKHKNRFVSLDKEINEGEVLTVGDLLHDTGLSVENQMLVKEVQSRVRSTISSLPKKYDMVLTMVDLNNLSYNEAAEIMNISVNKLKVWLFRAHKMLMNKIGGL
ncbi:MAG: sigma-70 family RNA polymerase sigma factor [Elusimicrobia bacterium]|nr:sigma-70 family RNA polymerase sigma factor [bacterium]MBU0951362.1 sigma-70 family RNA polymerase sigma factor [Elusimicrobiota bacterium]